MDDWSHTGVWQTWMTDHTLECDKHGWLITYWSVTDMDGGSHTGVWQTWLTDHTLECDRHGWLITYWRAPQHIYLYWESPRSTCPLSLASLPSVDCLSRFHGDRMNILHWQPSVESGCWSPAGSEHRPLLPTLSWDLQPGWLCPDHCLWRFCGAHLQTPSAGQSELSVSMMTGQPGDPESVQCWEWIFAIWNQEAADLQRRPLHWPLVSSKHPQPLCLRSLKQRRCQHQGHLPLSPPLHLDEHQRPHAAVLQRLPLDPVAVRHWLVAAGERRCVPEEPAPQRGPLRSPGHSNHSGQQHHHHVSLVQFHRQRQFNVKSIALILQYGSLK